jgi:hypothetical protein
MTETVPEHPHCCSSHHMTHRSASRLRHASQAPSYTGTPLKRYHQQSASDESTPARARTTKHAKHRCCDREYTPARNLSTPLCRLPAAQLPQVLLNTTHPQSDTQTQNHASDTMSADCMLMQPGGLHTGSCPKHAMELFPPAQHTSRTYLTYVLTQCTSGAYVRLRPLQHS